MGAGGIGGGGKSDCPPGIGRDTVLLEDGAGAGLDENIPPNGSQVTKRSTSEPCCACWPCCAAAGADHKSAIVSAAPQALNDVPIERPGPLIMD